MRQRRQRRQQPAERSLRGGCQATRRRLNDVYDHFTTPGLRARTRSRRQRRQPHRHLAACRRPWSTAASSGLWDLYRKLPRNVRF